MWKKKVHKEKKYLLAYILKGSIASLINYVNTHPKSKDNARKEIIQMKYILSKCTPVIRNIIFKIIKEHEQFRVERDVIWDGSDHRLVEYSAYDISTRYKFKAYDDDKETNITLSDETKISDSIHDHQMFIYAVIGSVYIEQNIRKFEEEIEQLKTKNKVIAAYT